MRGRTSEVRTRVRFGETDAAGIVFSPTFYVWFDVGTHALVRAATGALPGEDGRPRFPIPLVESGATFVSQLRHDDEIAIRSTVTALGTSSMRIEHEVVRLADGVVAARGFEVRVHVRRENGAWKASPLPDDLRDGLATGVSAEEVA
ncbi:MAG TPA: thioesterase family protein [Candidatus Baltobacteraceae bacterium]|nr:thioesterase family protein [Candidatus Baltobacteraceae bacterium]